MIFNPDIHRRRSIRLNEYDYSTVGAYFVTICAQGRECLFGEIVDGKMGLNNAGRMVANVWNVLPERFAHVALDEYVVMPNHFHGIILLNCCADGRGESCIRSVRPETRSEIIGLNNTGDQQKTGDYLKTGDHQKQGDHKDRPYGTYANSVGRIVQAFKSLTTVEYVHGVQERNWPQFFGKLWQRNYFERIIRNDTEMTAIREYIQSNPLKWALDKENPQFA